MTRIHIVPVFPVLPQKSPIERERERERESTIQHGYYMYTGRAMMPAGPLPFTFLHAPPRYFLLSLPVCVSVFCLPPFSYVFCLLSYSYSPLQTGWQRILRLFLKNFKFSTRRTGILMGFMICIKVLRGTNPQSHRQNSGSLETF